MQQFPAVRKNAMNNSNTVFHTKSGVFHQEVTLYAPEMEPSMETGQLVKDAKADWLWHNHIKTLCDFILSQSLTDSHHSSLPADTHTSMNMFFICSCWGVSVVVFLHSDFNMSIMRSLSA